MRGALGLGRARDAERAGALRARGCGAALVQLQLVLEPHGAPQSQEGRSWGERICPVQPHLRPPRLPGEQTTWFPRLAVRMRDT